METSAQTLSPDSLEMTTTSDSSIPSSEFTNTLGGSRRKRRHNKRKKTSKKTHKKSKKRSHKRRH